MTAMPIYGPEVQRKPATHRLPMSPALIAHLRIADPEYQTTQQNIPRTGAVIGPCKDCRRTMVMQTPYKRVARWREQGYVRASAHGMCNGCYSRAYRWGTLPNPAPPLRGARNGRIYTPIPYDVLGRLLSCAPVEVKEWAEFRLGNVVVTRAIEAASNALASTAEDGQP